MSETYKHALYDGSKIQVDSAIRDGAGANIENTYAKQDGYYESMGVGTATLSDNFNTNMTLIGTVPYLFRTAGGSLEIGGQCKEEKIIGCTVIWNQLVNSGAASVATTSGHIYLTRINGTQTIIESAGTAITINDDSADNVFDLTLMFGDTMAAYIKTLETQTSGAGVAFFRNMFPKLYYQYNAGQFLNVKTSGKKIVGFNAYNNTTGTAQLLGGNKYQVSGTYTTLSYTDINGTTTTPSLDADNCFTPTNNGTLTVTGGNATDTCINLYWDGERDGEWEEYEEHTYATGAVELRGKIDVDSNGVPYYTGDEYRSNGTVTRYYAYNIPANILQFNQLLAADLFTTATQSNVTLTNNGDGSVTIAGTVGIGESVTFTGGNTLALTAGTYGLYNVPIQIGFSGYGTLIVIATDTTITPTFTISVDQEAEEGITINETFYPMLVNLTALFGTENLTGAYARFTNLFTASYYEYSAVGANSDGATGYIYQTVDYTNYMYNLGTPTTETTTSYVEVQTVDNWGTEEWIVDTSDDVAMPVGHYTEYLPDLKAKLEVAPEAPEEDGYYLMQRDNGLNEYAPFVSVLNNSVININGASVAGTGDLELVEFGIIRLTD